MKRYKHSLSHYNLATFNMGMLVPVGNFEVLPGDSVRMSTSCLLRLSPLMTPVMHPVSVRIHHWFVPYRLLWDGWEDFITGGPDGLGPGEAIPSFQGEAPPKSLLDYMGVPPGVTVDVNTLMLRAYNMIWNNFYRDQDLQTEALESNGWPLNVCWEKDYITTARPWTQKGPEVTLPIGTTAPIKGIGFLPTLSGAPTAAASIRENTGLTSYAAQIGGVGIAGNLSFKATNNTTSAAPDIHADLGAAGAVAVNDVRLAFALQRYQEARAQYGSRYTEYLRYLGVQSSDARLQLPEYLGGGKATVSFSEVLRTGNSDGEIDDAPIGEMSGHGISAMRSRRFTRFFEEHGVVMALASVRPRSMYASGLARHWFRRVKEDFWQKELEQIGQQEVYNKEVYADHTSPNGVFGYNDRYAEYRHQSSYVSGDFRTTLNDWHLARIFASDPALNADMVKCEPSKRIFAEQTEDCLWGMFSHDISMRRLVGNRTIGRIF